MTELIIFGIISLILFTYIAKRSLEIRSYVSNIILILNIVGIIIMPLIYVKTNKIDMVSRIISLILGIILPIVIIIIEYLTKVSYDEKIILYIAEFYEFTKNRKKAKDIIVKYLEKYDDSYLLHKKLATIYEKEGGTRKAIDEYVEAVSIKGTDYESYFRVIELLEYLDKKDEAITLIERLLKVYKRYPKAYIMYANLILEKGNLKEVAKIYEEGLSYNKESKEIMYNLASIYVRLNEYSLAKKNLESIFKLDKKSHIVCLNLAQIAMIEREYSEAKMYLDIAKKEKEIEDIVYYEIAKINVLERKEEEAISNLNKALEINSNIIVKINATEIFKEIRHHTIMKVELIQRKRVEIEEKYVDTINMLEEALELIMIMDKNENADKAHIMMQQIIREKDENKTIEDMEEKQEKANKFIEKHISGINESFDKYFYGEKRDEENK
ncbi:MAG: hypothetical protein HG467_000455 [Clostridiales bacterium]|nr:hypothetical protein [Clostridiales bacterium]